jgi:hypothetical protein
MAPGGGCECRGGRREGKGGEEGKGEGGKIKEL